MERVVEAFSRLSELPPSERELELGALTREDPALAEELRSLLKSSQQAEDFLETGSGLSFERVLGTAKPSSSRPSLVFQAGDRLDNFEIVRHIGSGGASVVYLAKDVALGRRVALKIIKGQSPEGKLRSALVHENIVRLYEERADLLPGHLVLVMEYVVGPTLKEYLDACPGVPEPGRWPLLRSFWPDTTDELQGLKHHVEYTFALSPMQAVQQSGMRFLEAIEYSHKMGVLHLDFKPANVIIAPPYARLLVTDFNVALSRRMSGSHAKVLGGTLEYMAPEQKQAMLTGDASLIDERSDIYSIGAVMKYHKSVVAPDPTWFKAPGDAELGAALDRMIERATAQNPHDRYQSASEMYREIAELHRYLPAERRETQASTSARKVIAVSWIQAALWALAIAKPEAAVGIGCLGLASAVLAIYWMRRGSRHA